LTKSSIIVRLKKPLRHDIPTIQSITSHSRVHRARISRGHVHRGSAEARVKVAQTNHHEIQFMDNELEPQAAPVEAEVAPVEVAPEVPAAEAEAPKEEATPEVQEA
jgi:hypothetical protein